MSEILPRFAINHNLVPGLVRNVDEADRDPARQGRLRDGGEKASDKIAIQAPWLPLMRITPVV